MVDESGTTAYVYTSGGFLYPFANDTVTNFYSNRMRVGFGLQQPAGAWTNGFGYDAAKRLTSVTSTAGTFTYNYDLLRQREVTNLTLPNTSYISNNFDPVARLLETFLKTSGNTVLDSAQYGYNLAGQRTNFTNTAGTIASYTYDPAGQLTVAASTTSSENRGYAYDAAWNLTNRTNNGAVTHYTNNGLNELTAEGSVTCRYDAAGNLTNKNTTTNFFYDGENRLIAVEYKVGSLLTALYETTFVYDGLGRLRAQLQWQTNSGGGGDSFVHPPGVTLDAGTTGGSWTLIGGTYYVYDGKRVIQERNTNNTPTVSYSRGNDLSGSMEGAGGIGGLLERADGYNSSTGTWTNHNFYHADGNGNITCLESNVTQTVAASYRYDAYGNTLASSGSLASSNTYRFSSKEFIPTAGLYYYLYRFYDPALQRWVNRDPNEEDGGINLYDFVFNCPQGHIDPDGQNGLALPIGTITTVITTTTTLTPLVTPVVTVVAPVGTAIGGYWIGDQLGELGGNESLHNVVGNILGTAYAWCMANHGERKIQGNNPNPWKGFRQDPKDPSKGWRKDPQDGKLRPARRPEGPPPPGKGYI